MIFKSYDFSIILDAVVQLTLLLSVVLSGLNFNIHKLLK